MDFHFRWSRDWSFLLFLINVFLFVPLTSLLARLPGSWVLLSYFPLVSLLTFVAYIIYLVLKTRGEPILFHEINRSISGGATTDKCGDPREDNIHDVSIAITRIAARVDARGFPPLSRDESRRCRPWWRMVRK